MKLLPSSKGRFETVLLLLSMSFVKVALLCFAHYTHGIKILRLSATLTIDPL